MNPQEYSLNIRPGAGYAQTVKVSQGDVGRPLRFNLLDGAEALGLQTGTVITIHGTKPSGLGFTEACTWSGSAASVTTTLEMTQENGTFPAELVLTLGNEVIGTANFMMNVERSPHDENTIDGTYDVADSIFARMDTLEEGLDATNAEVEQLAESVPTVDATLTVSGAAADAKKTGDELTQLKSDLSETDEEVTGVTNLESYYANVQATSGTSIKVANHIFDVTIPQGKYYSFEIEYSGTSEYQLYADEVKVLGKLYANNKYIFYAGSNIEALSIYTTPNVTELVRCTLKVFDFVENTGIEYLEKQTEAMVAKRTAIPFILLQGFYNTNGTLNNSVDNEVHTQPIIVTGGEKINIDVTLVDQTKPMYIAYFAWDSSDNVLGRTVINSTNTGSYSGVLTVPSNVSKLSITYKTYGNSSFKLQKEWKQFDSYVMDAVSINQPSNTVRTVAHRGDDVCAPQCTAPSYIIARKHGISIAENDLWLSEDGEFVMWHDTTLKRLGNLVDINGYLMYTDGTNYYWVNNSTVYTWNGSTYVSSEMPLSGLTRCAGANYAVNSQGGAIGLPLNVLKRIDFGVYKGQEFKGTQILTFEEWIILCKQLGMEVYVDKKMSYTNEMLTSVANIVKKCGMGKYASWLGIYNISQINLLRSIIPDARVGILRHPSAEDIATYTPVNTGRGFFFNGDGKTMTAETIQMGLDAGFEVEVWYVDVANVSEEDQFNVIRNAVSYGVTGIALDHYRVDQAFAYLLEQY